MPSQPAGGATPLAPSAEPVHPQSLRELAQVVRTCTACSLHRDRGKPVVGEGPEDARLVLVGAAPRRHEDLLGTPFAGARRNVLEHALAEAGIGIDEVRLTTLVRCRPSEDRLPTAAEARACAPHLREELRLVGAEVVVTLGAAPTAAVLGRPVPIERVGGYRFGILQGITLIPSRDPNDAVRGSAQATRALHRDFAVAKGVLDGRLRAGSETIPARSRRPAGG